MISHFKATDPQDSEMEEAYNELYQQFIRLRSLCLRQAALLHQLKTALQKQQGTTVPNGDLSDKMSIPVQFTQEFPLYFCEKPQPPTASAHNPEAKCCVDCLSRNMGTFSDVLAEDMSKLCMDFPLQRNKDEKLEQRIVPLLTMDSSRRQGASPSESKSPTRRPMPSTPSLVTDLPSLPGGLLLSEMALQSHKCDFCEAVFPGDTTTRGEFLRHLHTHIT